MVFIAVEQTINLNWIEIITLLIAISGLFISLHLLNLDRKLRKNEAIPILYFCDDELFGSPLEYKVSDDLLPFSLTLVNYTSAIALNLELEIRPDFKYLMNEGFVKKNR